MKKVILGAILVAGSMAASAGIVMPNCGSECWNHQNIGASPCVANGTCGPGGGVPGGGGNPPAPPPACTWQNVAGQRNGNQWYTNTTGHSIQVDIQGVEYSWGALGQYNFYVNGTLAGIPTSGGQGASSSTWVYSATIYPNQTYAFGYTPGARYWSLNGSTTANPYPYTNISPTWFECR